MDDSCATIEKYYELRKFLMLRWLEVEMKLKSAKETNRKLGHSFMKVRNNTQKNAEQKI